MVMRQGNILICFKALQRLSCEMYLIKHIVCNHICVSCITKCMLISVFFE